MAGKSIKITRSVKKAKSGNTVGQNVEVVRRDQLEALTSIRRRDILDQLSANGPMSISDLAGALGLQASSLYFHIERFLELGLVREIGLRPSGGKPQQVYELVSQRLRLLEALQDPKNREVMSSIAASICRQAARDFALGYDAPHHKTSGPKRNTRVGRLVGRPDPETLKKINAHFDAITELLTQSMQGDGPLVAVSWAAAPVIDNRSS